MDRAACAHLQTLVHCCRVTEADVRLYPTIIRYDTAYAVLFKCSRKRIGDYPNLAGWLRDMYQLKVEESDMQVLQSGSLGHLYTL